MAFIVSHAFPIFDKMFKGYDKLNASVQENLTGIRVVKAYVREDHENKKFCDATDNLKDLSVHAERLVIMNQPVMQFTVYTCILLISWIGAKDRNRRLHDHRRTDESFYLYHTDPYESDDDVHGICYGDHGKVLLQSVLWKCWMRRAPSQSKAAGISSKRWFH